MKELILFSVLIIGSLVLMEHCESKRDPYEIGTHSNYHIHCENGFVYKQKRNATMQVFNSDGTPLKCGSKIY